MPMQSLRLQKPTFGSFILLILAGIVFAPTVRSAQPAGANRTSVALVNGVAEISSLATCLETNVAESGLVVKVEQLGTGLSHRSSARR